MDLSGYNFQRVSASDGMNCRLQSEKLDLLPVCRSRTFRSEKVNP